MTDSSCDVTDDLLQTWQVRAAQLDVLVDGEEAKKNNEVDIAGFYQKLRDGKTARTSAVNIGVFKDVFTAELAQGQDILYLGFSSALSTTFQSSEIAAAELREEYPDRTIRIVDTLAASLGQGLLVHLAAKMQQEGADIETVYRYVSDNKLHICHWFTVDDLHFLKRGGRVSAAVALVGSMLGIKPVMHMDDTGHLVNMSKSRGRDAAIVALADKYGQTVMDKNAPVFISHGDCIEDAKKLESMLRDTYGVQDILIGYVGPVIGAHSGPGTLAFFFLGEQR